MASSTEQVSYDQLSPYEAGFLHPANWDGQIVGFGNPDKKGTVKPFKPLHHKWSSLGALVSAGQRMQHAMQRSRQPAFRPLAVYGPGEEFSLTDHQHGIVVFDQSTLLTRREFALDRSTIPEQPPFSFPNVPPSSSAYYATGPHMHYLREPSPVATIGRGENRQAVRSSQMELHVGAGSYHYAVGALAVPETVAVGEVSHLVMPDGQQMLTRTHNVFVFPLPGRIVPVGSPQQ